MTARVFHADLWGKRDDKYAWLDGESVETTKWTRVEATGPFYLFRPLDRSEVGDYDTWPSIREVFPVNSVGIVSARDHLTMAFTADELWNRVRRFSEISAEEARAEFQLRQDVRDWKVSLAQADLRSEPLSKKRLQPVLYRPFDKRFTYYTGTIRGFIGQPVRATMGHMLAGENLAFCTTKSVEIGTGFSHIFASRAMTQHHTVSLKEVNYQFSLYLYPGVGKADQQALEQWPEGKDRRRPNLEPGFVHDIESATGLSFVSDGRGDLKADTGETPVPQGTFGPEDVLAYIYAVFHWPEYRRRYEPMLKLDFPRVPPPTSRERFVVMARLGHELLGAHLLEDETITGKSVAYPVQGDNVVAKGYPKYVPPGGAAAQAGKKRQVSGGKAGRVHINAEQYFEGVEPGVWEFQIGGYQVCEKWLKDRRGRALSYDDLTHYPRVVEALRRTIELMGRIEAI